MAARELVVRWVTHPVYVHARYAWVGVVAFDDRELEIACQPIEKPRPRNGAAAKPPSLRTINRRVAKALTVFDDVVPRAIAEFAALHRAHWPTTRFARGRMHLITTDEPRVGTKPTKNRPPDGLESCHRALPPHTHARNARRTVRFED